MTHKNSLVSEESYQKVFDRTKAVFDMGTSLGSNPKLKKKSCVKNFQSSGVPIRRLTKTEFFGDIVKKFTDSL